MILACGMYFFFCKPRSGRFYINNLYLLISDINLFAFNILLFHWLTGRAYSHYDGIVYDGTTNGKVIEIEKK